jgi:hypothetical protein
VFQTFRPVLCAEFLVAIQVKVSWKMITERKVVLNLGAGADDRRLETADTVADASIAGQLLVGITHQAEL